MTTSVAVPSNEELVQGIVRNKDVSTYFQPVVSITGKSIVGFEAFSRGGGGAGACAIGPQVLFDHDLFPQTQLNIDRLCREKALEQFKRIDLSHKGLLLYVNINPDVLAHVNLQEKFLYQQVLSQGIEPSSVAVESPMSMEHLEMLAQFRNVYCNLGFKMCLDNCGVSSPFTYIATQFKPQFIKVNRTFFGNSERVSCSGPTLEALCRLAGRLGISLVAQGVENEEESLRLLMAGVHLQQGYYYTKDQHGVAEDPSRAFLKKIIDAHEKYKNMKRVSAHRKKERFSFIFSKVTSICARLACTTASQFEDVCKRLISNDAEIISMFVLDRDGVQATEYLHAQNRATNSNAYYMPTSRKGSEHSAQDYVLNLELGYDRFVTPPFVSSFSGEEVCMISKAIFNEEGQKYTVCIEVRYPN